MATMWMTMTTPSPLLYFQGSKDFTVRSLCLPLHLLTSQTAKTINFCSAKQNQCGRLLNPCNSSGEALRCFSKPISAVGSGLEASVTDPKDNAVTVKNARVVVEFQDDEKIQLRVDLMGEDTQIVFDKVLANLARTAPPVPGFRRQKGGKTSKEPMGKLEKLIASPNKSYYSAFLVPKSFLLQIIGEERVTKFVIQEIVNSTMADYVKKENLTVKENKINTTQSAEELKLSFTPGKEFGFNATLELEKSETETSSSSSEI